MKGQGDAAGPRENEIRRYIATEYADVLAKYAHETDPELYEFELSIDDEVPRKCLAETRDAHPEIGSLERQWTELGRYHVEIIVVFRHQLLIVPLGRYPVSVKTIRFMCIRVYPSIKRKCLRAQKKDFLNSSKCGSSDDIFLRYNKCLLVPTRYLLDSNIDYSLNCNSKKTFVRGKKLYI